MLTKMMSLMQYWLIYLMNGMLSQVMESYSSGTITYPMSDGPGDGFYLTYCMKKLQQI